jgi:type IV pilus assembly protein PilB
LLDDIADDTPVAKLVNLILLDAIKQGASAIHVEADEEDFRVCFLIAGSIHEMMRPPPKLRDAITRRLKLMAELDIFEHRLPQDGLFQIRIGDDTEVDFRVSVRPTLSGEKVELQLRAPELS